MNAESKEPNTPHPLQELSLLSAAQIQLLEKHWIMSVEELLAVLAVPEAGAALSALLGMDEAQQRTLTAGAQNLLGADLARHLGTTAPGRALGVLLTEEQQKRFER